MATTYPPPLGAPTADPWAIAEADFPRDEPLEEQLKFLVGYAALAPSGHNSQPWLFWVEGDKVELYADRARALPVVDPDDRELVISCGCALAHYRIALAYFGFAAAVKLAPPGAHGDLMAVVRVRDPAST